MSAKQPEKVQSVRLTEDMRNDITRALVNNSLGKRDEAHKLTEFKLAARIYNSVFSAADRKKMEALPEGWLPKESFIDTRLGGQFHRYHFSTPDKSGKREHRRFTSKTLREDFVIEVRSDLGTAMAAHRDEGEAIRVARNELKAKAAGVLASVTTTARLAEVWPEVVPFIPKYVPRQLPAVRRDELNAAFGLRIA